ncbi:hypothetical protein CDO44_26645 [Pigmentiphaga sp. NML080357]|nr:hypothetical protein CDO44_26645 [Pigmentiphaga sp. NML080357]
MRLSELEETVMENAFSAREFRNALGLFATGVAVATASNHRHRAGITINSFASVSLSPPLVLFSAAKTLNSIDTFNDAAGFTINVLSADQASLSAQFAKAGEDKWLNVGTAAGKHGGIVITPCLVSFDCKLHAKCDGGDHVIFIGEVTDIIDGTGDQPLLYFRGSYRDLAPRSGARLAA